jgi:hypothetical protein
MAAFLLRVWCAMFIWILVGQTFPCRRAPNPGDDVPGLCWHWLHGVPTKKQNVLNAAQAIS